MLITFVLGELFRMLCIGIILFVVFSAGVKICSDLMDLVIK